MAGLDAVGIHSDERRHRNRGMFQPFEYTGLVTDDIRTFSQPVRIRHLLDDETPPGEDEDMGCGAAGEARSDGRF
jgi:hypothetical protein